MSRYSFSKDVQVQVGGTPFILNRDLLAEKSSKLCKLLKENPDEDISHLLPEISAFSHTFEMVARFCYGYPLKFTPENVIPLSCLACYLGMTESVSPHNLLSRSLNYFEHEIITGWNESIRSLKAIDNPTVLQQAAKLGLIDGCMDSIINKALADPLLLGEPIKNPFLDDSDDDAADDDDDQEVIENVYKPNAKRQLFVLDWKSEELSLTTLHLKFYEPIIRGMIQCQVDSNNIASNLYHYAKKWVFLEPKEMDGESSSSEGDSSNSKKLAIEAIERLLPHDRGILPCALLSEMLQYAMALEANAYCREGFEVRIGRQLDLATVNDLLIPSSQGCYCKDEKYDTECVRRILKHFYHNFTGQDQCGLNIVAELVEDFLGEIASDIDLKKDSFISIAEMSIAASEGTQRTPDGIYRAVDIYLNKHSFFTESEREEICGVLDWNKMSPEACEHAAQNDRLPVRVAVQVLFVGQLHLRETITKEVASEDGSKKSKSMEVDEEVKGELEKMTSKVMELEKECLVMRKEIKKGYLRKTQIEKEKSNVWKEMKRKLGCISSLNNSNCHLKKKKKVHPR